MFLLLINDVFIVNNGSDDGSSGTLRWAIEMANVTPGSDTIIFNIPTSDPSYVCLSGNCWWRITLSSKLPSITAPLFIDGWSQTENVGNTNLCALSFRTGPDSAGWTSVRNTHSRTVGTLGNTLPPFPCPEIEVYLNGLSDVLGILEISSSQVEIRGLAFYGGGGGSGSQVIRVRPGSENITLRELFVGVPADGSQPTDSTPSDCVFVDGNTSGRLVRLYVGFCGSHGIKFGNTSASTSNGWIMDSCEVFASGWFFDQADNVNVYFKNVLIRHNLIHSADNPNGSDIRVFGAGVEVRYNADSVSIFANTIYNNSTKGIFVDGGSDDVFVGYNLIYGNGWRMPGPGVGVGERRGISHRITILRNHFADNGGLAIDLDSSGASGFAGDGVTCNDGLRQSDNPNYLIDYPYLDSARLYVSSGDTILSVWGRALTGADSVEIYLVSTIDDQNCPSEMDGHGEGGIFLKASEVILNSFQLILKVDSLGPDWSSGSLYLTALSHDELGNTSEFSHNLPVPTPVGSNDDLVVSELAGPLYNSHVRIYTADGRLVFVGSYGEFEGTGLFFILSEGKIWKILR
ncbi:MAG: right-handed parallel beta-helix repeat-containing protein [Thermotogae bacterium]|nr:right-handed parallel beta-helix repeat-containing protein [Thermotogota bacterium]